MERPELLDWLRRTYIGRDKSAGISCSRVAWQQALVHGVREKLCEYWAYECLRSRSHTELHCVAPELPSTDSLRTHSKSPNSGKRDGEGARKKKQNTWPQLGAYLGKNKQFCIQLPKLVMGLTAYPVNHVSSQQRLVNYSWSATANVASPTSPNFTDFTQRLSLYF